jgi:hypothetical protein
MFNVSAQAQVFGVLLMSMLMIICTVIIATRGYIGILYALSTVVAAIPFILTGVYMMDCLSYGSCDMFAWIIVIFIFIIFTMALIWSSIIYFETQAMVSNMKQNNDEYRSRNSIYNNNDMDMRPLSQEPLSSISPSSVTPLSDSPSSDSPSSDSPSSSSSSTLSPSAQSST